MSTSPTEVARGYLFVVHGKIEQLVHDAVIVPVDHWLAFKKPVWAAGARRGPTVPIRAPPWSHR